MLAIQWLPPYTIDWQHLACLLYALRQLRGENSRFETTVFIQRCALLSLNGEDYAPYRTQKEPSWQTDIAWARKIGVLMGLISSLARDSWALTRDGIATIDHLLEQGQKGEIDAGHCFLWSLTLKRVFDPDYVASSSDTPRPSKRHKAAFDNCITFASMIIENGRGVDIAEQLSEELGRIVLPELESLATALKKTWLSTRRNR